MTGLKALWCLSLMIYQCPNQLGYCYNSLKPSLLRVAPVRESAKPTTVASSQETSPTDWLQR
ncbi:hypothetical protein [Nostoc sp. FACHB-280]|uniref:hypothetical protein n=1 Tax=Nostoc sp. FACHB-280 TaxID=2692839 RepID=UPI00168B32F2|nr:hypothetical protein [Nostoc sp. FACHB-280]MBD2493775.1 hypothetical protein [Nostoc sp. FACHB-280]